MESTTAVAVGMIASALVTMACAIVLWRRRSLVGARSLAVASAAVMLWALFYAAAITAATLREAVLWGDLKYIGVCLLPPAWLIFALRYTGRGHVVSTGLFVALLVHPVAMGVLLAFPQTHDLVRAAAASQSTSDLPVITNGVLFWPHYAYSTALLATAAVLIARTLIATSRRYTGPSLALLAATSLPWIVNVAYNWPGLGFNVDLTPAAYAVVDVMFLWGVFNFKLFNIVPVAREVVLDQLQDVVVVVDAYGRVADLNTAAETLLRVSRRQAAGIPLRALLPDQPDLLAAADEVDRRDITVVTPDGSVHYEVRISQVRAGSAVVPGYVLVFQDVSDRHRAQRRLEQLVYYDQLTQLPNRLLFSDRLDQALALARRTGHKVGVLFCDLDGFKWVNDTLGHEIGDLVLRETADRLKDCLRESDTPARMGGDEFIIVLPSLDSEASAVAVANKVLASIAQPYTAAGRRLRLSASIGIAVAPPHPFDRHALSTLADAAMYRAKAEGKNRHALADDTVNALTVVTTSDQHDVVAVEDRQSSLS